MDSSDINKHIIHVPANMEYITQWKDFSLPNFPHILDKQIPGCGFTEWAIVNPENTILCSPRKILLQNKFEQHKGEVFHTIGELEIIDRNLSKADNKKSRFDIYLEKIGDSLFNYIQYRSLQRLPIKILVTYDSYHLIKRIILKRFSFLASSFRIIVDEFQVIFIDSIFKSSTEMSFLDELKDSLILNKVCFVSATPILDKYLMKINYFKLLPYFKLDWSNCPGSKKLASSELKIKFVNSVFEPVKRIINSYLLGNYEYKIVKDSQGNIKKVESKEVVFYLNSVNNICSIINRLKLTPDQCNILIANTTDNLYKLKRKLGSKFNIGNVPLRGMPHKMFTFCTRTAYLGVDFYSTNARTVILSDANINTLVVDISLDIPQILGRQRLSENPWSNRAEFYCKPISLNKKVTKEFFEDIIKAKIETTEKLLKVFYEISEENRDVVANKFEKDAKYSNYQHDYVSINWENGRKMAVRNELVIIAEERAFEIQQMDYSDRFQVFSKVKQHFDNTVNIDKRVIEFFDKFNSLSTVYDKLRFLCEYPAEKEFIINHILPLIKSKYFYNYYVYLGPDRIKSLSYNITLLNKELDIVCFNEEKIKENVKNIFLVGGKYTRKYIKDVLSSLYEKSNYKKNPKASDILNWFDVKEILINSKNKRERGYLIISQK